MAYVSIHVSVYMGLGELNSVDDSMQYWLAGLTVVALRVDNCFCTKKLLAFVNAMLFLFSIYFQDD